MNDTGTEYVAPSSAVKSGGIIQQLAEIKQSNALQHGDTVTANLCVQFQKLCDVNRANEVSCVARRNLQHRKRSVVIVIQLNKFLVTEANKFLQTALDSADAFFSSSVILRWFWRSSSFSIEKGRGKHQKSKWWTTRRKENLTTQSVWL